MIELCVSQFEPSIRLLNPKDLKSSDECLNVKNGPYSCSNDCTRLNYCVSGKLVGVDCSELTGGKKTFCDGQIKQCVEATNDAMICYHEENCIIGFYPDLINCRRYTFCDGVHKYYMECKNNKVFDPATKKCQDLSTTVKCYSFSETYLCRGKTGLPVEYPVDRNKYVFCLETGPVLMSCDMQDVFYKDTCIFNCPSVGKFVDITNPRYYYDCQMNVTNKIILPIRQKCPQDFVFLEMFEICVKIQRTSQDLSVDTNLINWKKKYL